MKRIKKIGLWIRAAFVIAAAALYYTHAGE